VTDRIAFGQRLRRERERRGLTLAAIAQSTKIKASLLDALERGDLSHWPIGIFGRGFLRAYLDAIHLPAASWVSEFQTLGSAAPTPNGASGGERLRLTLEPEPGAMPPVAGRLVAALGELAMVVALSLLIARATNVNVWTVGAALACAYSAIATMCLGRSPALWLVSRRASQPAPPVPAIVDLTETNGSPRLTLAQE